jgi:hypothetical protein
VNTLVENPWAWQSRNPYLSTAFQVIDVDPTADRPTTRTKAALRRRRISHAADRFPLFGRTLTVAELNEAEEQLTTPPGRLRNELLTHAPESGDTDQAELTGLLELLEEAGFFAPAARPGTLPADSGDLLDQKVLLALLPDPSAQPLAALWTDDHD